jgi:ABC-type multidrug transport system fused ATPase/permease subunit
MTPFQTRYYNFFINLYKYEKRIKLSHVDFDEPWWNIILKQKLIFFAMLFAITAFSAYDSIMPTWIAQSIQANNINMLVGVILGRIAVALLVIFIFNYNPIFQLGTINSVFMSANKRVLEVDPINHSTKSSGVIISKINKGSAAYEDLLDVLSFELWRMIIGISASIVVLSLANLYIGLIAGIMILVTSICSVILTTYNNQIFKPVCITAEDKFSQTSVETLQQSAYIRSVFGTSQQLKTLSNNVKTYIGVEGTRWRATSSGYVFVLVLFFISVLIVSVLVFKEVQAGNVPSTIGIGLIASYIGASKEITNVGNQIKKLTASHSRITDLFDFMQTFGQQTFPVLDDKTVITKN